MDELIELKNKLIGRQRIRNNKLEFALKEALFFLEKPFDVDLLQSHFIGNILSSFKDNPAELLALSNSNPGSNSNSMTAQAKKYLKKINKKHDNKSSNQNSNPVLRISKEENELCMQFSINYLKQALEWIEKDEDIEDCEKFKIKRYISVDKIPKPGETDNPVTDNDKNNSDLNNPLSNSSSENNINVSFSKIKINYQKGPSTEELTNEINLDDYFENPDFNNNKIHNMKKSSTFRRDKSGMDPEFSNFTKSKSVNSLFAVQYSNSDIDFSNEQTEKEQNVKQSDTNNNDKEEKQNAKQSLDTNNNDNEGKQNSSSSFSSVSQNINNTSSGNKSNKSSHKNIPILIKPLNADSEYNHINRETSDPKIIEKEQKKVSTPSIDRLKVEDSDVKRSLSLNAKEAKIMSAKLYNNLLRENNMINVMIPVKNEEIQNDNDNKIDETNSTTSTTTTTTTTKKPLLQPKLDLLSNYKYVNNANLEELTENFDKHFPEKKLAKNNNTFYFSINGEDGMILFKEVLRAMNPGGSEKVNNLDKTNFVTSIEYNEQLKKIEALEKENKRLNYQLEKKTLEYDHEHMAKVMLDKELEDLTSQLFLQANKLVETECHKLEDTKIKLKELNDKYNNVKAQLEKRENELNGLKKMMIKNEEKKVPKRTKIFPNKYPNNNSNTLTNAAIANIQAPIIPTVTSLDKYNTNSITNVSTSDEVLATSYNSTTSKPNSMDNNASYMITNEFNSGTLGNNSTSPFVKMNGEIFGNDMMDYYKTKENSNGNTLTSEAISDFMKNTEMNDDEKGQTNDPQMEEPSEEIQSWNLYSTKVIAIQNDKIFSYIDGGQFNEFQNYIRDSLIKVNNNKKKKSNIFCLPNTSFMKRCIEDEIYPCLFEHCSDPQSSGQNKRNSITKTHVNFKKKLQKALSCNGIIIIPYELLNKNGKLIKTTAPVLTKEKQNADSNSADYDEDDAIENDTSTQTTKKIEYYLEYDFVHPLPPPPRKKCCLCMNYRDCHYHVFFRNIDNKDGTLPSPLTSDQTKLVNNVNIVYNNNTPNTQDNTTSFDSTNTTTNRYSGSSSTDKDSLASPTAVTTINVSTQGNKKSISSNNELSPMLSPVSKTVEDYTAKCYNISSEFLHQLRTENSVSFNEQFFLCPICRDKIVSVADLYSYLSSLESKLTGSSKGQSSILNMFKNVILLKRRIATAKLGALQFFELNNDLFKDESLSALYDNSSEEWENYVKII
ncbi:hypothetical protein PIROE2DRAFT_5070 [Piromyces sp. E2]|nr:hypothetical protein PIROE2DRAFT_5070 [Piromyces sp. E2]|eukprot:OUM67441.1 hypothetical protein PIROE2DRAFT_5070 [Piromyces sp. E2]